MRQPSGCGLVAPLLSCSGRDKIRFFWGVSCEALLPMGLVVLLFFSQESLS